VPSFVLQQNANPTSNGTSNGGAYVNNGGHYNNNVSFSETYFFQKNFISFVKISNFLAQKSALL
jgi:hypothetical protein